MHASNVSVELNKDFMSLSLSCELLSTESTIKFVRQSAQTTENHF